MRLGAVNYQTQYTPNFDSDYIVLTSAAVGLIVSIAI